MTSRPTASNAPVPGSASSSADPAAPHFVVLVPDGVGYRNFVLGKLCALLPGRVTVLHALAESDLAGHHLDEQIESGRVAFETLPSFREPPSTRCLREAKSLSQLYRHRIEDAGEIQLRRLLPKGRLRQRMLVRAARLLARWGQAKPDRFDRMLHRSVARHATTRSMIQRFKKLKPDVVFCTHQRASVALPAMTAAVELGIPTSTFVFSWDNLPKGRMPVKADQYLVWGSTMQQQMRTYFPEVRSQNIISAGTPQFEPYFDETRYQTKEQFCADSGLDPNRPIVCFSGDDESTSPKDPVFLRDLATSLRAQFNDNADPPQILFRRSPVDNSGRYRPVLDEFPEIVDAPPRWRQGAGDWQGVLPTDEDVTHLVNLVRHSDLVVNLGSTMAMDFAIFDKPAIFLNYEPAGPFDPAWNTAAAYQLPHFRSVFATEPVHWANSPDSLGQLVEECLANPGLLSQQRQQWIETICRQPLDEASARCADALVALVS